jgi:cation diffusion facilitator CzcD-associated flavoprotein CzcO
LSIDKVWKTWNWSERFPGCEELQNYFRHVDRVLDLRKDAYFNTIVVSAKYKDGRWTVKTADGRTINCTYLVPATGSSYKKHIPAFPDLDQYKGRLYHAADWPKDGLDVSQKKVAVIGNGATGVQLVQELGKKAREFSLFIRNPIHALPMRQRKMSVEEQEASKSAYSFLYEGAQNSRAGFPFKSQTKSIWEATPEEREALMEEGWNRGGFAFNQSTYRDFIVNPEANKIFYDFWAKRVRQRVTDPKKAQIVAPIPQKSYFATKRPSLEQDYYEVINQSNVEVVDLTATPIKSFRKNGIETSDGTLHELDVVVLATGYDAVTGSLFDMGLEDKNGTPLREKWKLGIRTHLGLMIAGLPNCFMVYGPQAPTSFANGPPIIEAQIDIIADTIARCRKDKIAAIESTEEAAEGWAAAVRDAGNATLYPTADSWYVNLMGGRKFRPTDSRVALTPSCSEKY